MQESELVAYISVGMSALSLVGLTYIGTWRLGRMELKVDTMWDFLLRRAQSEAVQKGFATMNSPMIIQDHAFDIMAPVAAQLRSFYASFSNPPDDSELALLIEREFGDKILHEVCVPHGLLMGACLPVAIAVAKGTNKVVFH